MHRHLSFAWSLKRQKGVEADINGIEKGIWCDISNFENRRNPTLFLTFSSLLKSR